MNEEVIAQRKFLDLEKDEIYLKSVAKLGSSAKSIYIVENILSDEEHQVLFNFVNNSDQMPWIKEPWSTERLQSESMPENIIQFLKKVCQVGELKGTDYYDIQLSSQFEIGAFQTYPIYILTKWSKGSKMSAHVDTDSQKHQHIVCMYYINDNYDGGEISFPDYGVNIKPKSNSLVMFPGNENYIHEVCEVSSGFRYTFPMRFIFTGSTFVGATLLRKATKE